MIFEKLGPDNKKERMRNLEWLGADMIDAGIEFGPGTVYGSALIKVGKAQQSLGQTEREFVANSFRTFVQPLKKFLDEDMRTITVRPSQVFILLLITY
jgi:endophilin-B